MKPDIDSLLEKYYGGETTLEEEKRLREFFRSENVPDHLRSHAPQFRYFAEARSQEPSPLAGERMMAKVAAQGRLRSLTNWGLRIAAGLTLLAGGFVGGLLYHRDTERIGRVTADSPAGEMRKVLDLDQMAQSSASERIQAVNQVYDVAQADQEITRLLVNTLNLDDNVNVRMAACQALLRFKDEPGVREALIQSLKVQTSPNVQIALIDILVAIRERRAVVEMQRLAQNQQTINFVRLRAEEGIGRLTGAEKESGS